MTRLFTAGVTSQKAVQSRAGTLFGFAGLAAIVLLTACAFRLHLNLSTSGPLSFLIIVMVSVVWGFWEASVTSIIAVNCLDYFFVSPLLTLRVGNLQNWVALATFEIVAVTVSRRSARVHGQGRTEHLDRLTSELLQMARIDAAEVKLRRKRLCVLTFLEDILSRYHDELKTRCITLPGSASPLEVYGGREILGRAFEQFIVMHLPIRPPDRPSLSPPRRI